MSGKGCIGHEGDLPRILRMSPISDKGGHMYDIERYQDERGDWVEIGSQVGFREEYYDPDIHHNGYVVNQMPNYGDMVELIPCTWTELGSLVILDEPAITVEPWKIALI